MKPVVIPTARAMHGGRTQRALSPTTDRQSHAVRTLRRPNMLIRRSIARPRRLSFFACLYDKGALRSYGVDRLHPFRRATHFLPFAHRAQAGADSFWAARATASPRRWSMPATYDRNSLTTAGGAVSGEPAAKGD
jgi:hypothetical protein